MNSRSSTRNFPPSQVLWKMIQGRLLGDSEVPYRPVSVSLDGGAGGGVDANATERIAEGGFGHGVVVDGKIGVELKNSKALEEYFCCKLTP